MKGTFYGRKLNKILDKNSKTLPICVSATWNWHFREVRDPHKIKYCKYWVAKDKKTPLNLFDSNGNRIYFGRLERIIPFSIQSESPAFRSLSLSLNLTLRRTFSMKWRNYLDSLYLAHLSFHTHSERRFQETAKNDVSRTMNKKKRLWT